MKSFFSKGNEGVAIKPAATAVVLRQAEQGIEVLLLCRSKRSKFAQSVWVFPGGGVEEVDFSASSDVDSVLSDYSEILMTASCAFGNGEPLENESAAALELATRNAAIRETSEECALMLSHKGLVPYAHWTTPVGPPKRYATWFYFYLLEEAESEVAVDNQEIVDFKWLSPEQALRMQAEDELSLLPPTFITLLALSGYSCAKTAIHQLQTDEFVTILPKATRQGEDTVMLYPGDAGYEAGDASLHGARNRFFMATKGWRYEKSDR